MAENSSYLAVPVENVQSNFSDMAMGYQNSSLFLDVNTSSTANLTTSDFIDDPVLTMIENIVIPFISIFGLIGNTLSCIVFTRPTLHQNSCSFFLATRSVSDNAFLLSLFLIWISTTLDLEISKISGVCHAFIFLTYVFGCLSVWLVVLVTAENYIRICKPFLVNKICTVFNAKCFAAVIALVVNGFYSFPFWTMSDTCIPTDRYFKYIQSMIYADSLLTFILPIMVTTCLIGMIGITTLKSCKYRRRHSTSSILSKSPITKVTKMLLSVTLTFFFLNILSHIIRLRLAFHTFIQEDETLTAQDVRVYPLSLLLYYASLAVNIFIYYTFGIKFRAVFNRTFLRRRSSIEYALPQSELTKSIILSGKCHFTSGPWVQKRMMSESVLRIQPYPKRKVSSFF